MINDGEYLLVGGAIIILKNINYDRQWGLDDKPYMKWKTIQMFETTNQWLICWRWNVILAPSVAE